VKRRQLPQQGNLVFEEQEVDKKGLCLRGQAVCSTHKQEGTMGSFLSTQPEIRLVMVGLDNGACKAVLCSIFTSSLAGKTTILYQAKSGERVSSAPTIGFNVEVLTIANLRFTVWDGMVSIYVYISFDSPKFFFVLADLEDIL